MNPEVAEQLDISLRLLVAAVLGMVIGLEREIHAHPAGMRTHLLVSLGSAAFTVVSIFVFETPPSPNGTIPTDPSRVAAQIVSGIGFLGAGAIIVFSLGPLNVLATRIRLGSASLYRLELIVGRLEALGEVSRSLTTKKIEIAGVNSQRLGKGRYEIELDLRLPAGTQPQSVISIVSGLDDVEIIESGVPGE